MLILLEALYFMLPAYIANMMPVFVSRLPLFNFPLDHGKTWRGKRLFGSHKTYRGFLSGALAGVAVIFLQKKFAAQAAQFSLVQYATLTNAELISLGIAFGAGPLLFDLIKSFFKRRLGIADGKAWIPFDHLDFLGALILVSIVYEPPLLTHIIIIIILTPLLTFLTNAIAYMIGLKKVWW